MKLNSGFVPITILCGFTNINRIIARYANALANGMDIADIDVHHLLVCSAVQTKVLKIILLDQDGNVIMTHGEEGYEGMKGPKAFEAIGTDDDGDTDGDGEGVSHAETVVVKEKDRADASANVDAKSSSTNSTVILRDVPEEATEDDIRHVFEGDDGNAIIHNVQKEVGHCWFVTIDASTSQQDLVSILLNLRTKTICDEPIKARLKTQSTATQGTPMQGPGYNPHRSGYKVYAGDRISYTKKFNNSAGTGTKPYFSKPRGGKGGDHPGSGPYKGNNYDPSKNNAKPVEKAGPPPPLVEEHFPGLAGSPTIVSVIASSSADASASGESEAVGVPVPVAVKKDIVHASGYAAALKKAAPPVMEVSTENVKRTTPKPKSPARKKVVDAKSTGTVSTEGSIADDKSHASKETEVASFPAVKSWGGGRSFADILKKQEV